MKKVLLYIGLIAMGAFLWWSISPLFSGTHTQSGTDSATEARLRMQQEADERAAERSQSDATISKNEENSTPRPPAGTGTFVEGPFTIEGTDAHPARGKIEILHSQGEQLVRYSDYKGAGGSDLHVYLSTDLTASDHIDLGPTKGTEGTLIYGMPLDIDFSKYKYVLTWSTSANTLFDYAKIQ